jgi:F-type H+-transporting ATPase subunit delta
LLDLAVERKEIDAIRNDVTFLLDMLKSAPDLRAVLNSPVIKADKKESIMTEIIGKHVSALSMHFCNLVIRHGREGSLVEIYNAFVRLYDKHMHIVTAEITTAAELDAASLALVQGLVDVDAKFTVQLKNLVKPNLIGGFTVKVGDTLVDASVSTKLKNMRRSFQENPYLPEL